MGFYLNPERKYNSEPLANGGEAIITSPYFNEIGYSFIGFITANNEHQYKVVQASNGVSLEPKGSLKLFETNFTNSDYKKINSSGTTTVNSNLFGLKATGGSAYVVLYIKIAGGSLTSLNQIFSKRYNNYILSFHQSAVNFRNHYMYIGETVYNIITDSTASASDRFYFLRETSSVSALFYNNANTICWISSIGTTWTSQSLPASITIGGAASSSSLFVILTTSGVVYTSPSANTGTWIDRGTIGYYAQGLMAYGLNLFAAITASNTAKISTDNGVNWVSKTIPALVWQKLYFDEYRNLFILKPSGVNYFYTTTNFDTFQIVYLPANDSSIQVYLCNQLLIIGGYNSLDLLCFQNSNYSPIQYDDCCGVLPDDLHYTGTLFDGNFHYVAAYKKTLINNDIANPITPIISNTNYFLKEK